MLLFLLLLSTHSVVASPSTFSAAAAPRPHRPPTGAAAPTLTSLGSCTERPRASTAAAAAAHSPAPCTVEALRRLLSLLLSLSPAKSIPLFV